MTTWFTADWHLGHQNIITLANRPFHDLDEMHEVLARNWNRVVAPEDDVIVLGDVSLGPPTRHRAFIEGLHGTKHLVPGNHDGCWTGHRRTTRAKNKRQHYLDAGFFYVHDDLIDFELRGFGRVRLCHLPTEGDTQVDQRYDEHRPGDDGHPLICGHVHGLWAEKGRNINVGVDVRGFAPISDLELARIAHRVCLAPAHDALIGARDAH